MHSNEKPWVRSAVAGTLLAGLALAGCGGEEPPAALPVKSVPSATTVPPTSPAPVAPRPIEIFWTYRVGTLSATTGTACSAGPAPTDPACGHQLDAIHQAVTGFQAAIAQSIPGRDFPKIRDAANQVTKSIDILRNSNCYGLGAPGKKPGKNEAGLCGTFSRLALLSWLNFESTVEQS
ncbi:hypothetical protein [Amycolatopsis sp.]|uniref:hypothetical protein n=1 Tax=Amycolatopsis sp. TaxID=37632 RepID=UPI002D802D3C|nr:hypothetical protein [Amycolatopsis sp.]HET6706636.1 hypothetical protein [Amycolatopsis sp.]